MQIDGTNSYLVSNIRYLRKLFCVSGRALARLIGMREEKLRNIEAGRQEPVFTLRQVQRICAVFSLSAEHLFHSDLAGKPYTAFRQENNRSVNAAPPKAFPLGEGGTA